MANPILDGLAPELEALDFVEWDRFTVGDWDGQPYVTVYGWIDREDTYKDFVIILRWQDGATYYTTSSADRTRDIQRILFPHDPAENHNDCQRVEEYIDIPNAIRLMADGGQVECEYCGATELAYALESDRGTLNRCIPCLAIEQGQRKFSLPFDVWLDRDDIEPPDKDKFPDAPDFGPFDPREHGYEMARGWFTVLARWRSDDPLLERDPDAIGTVHEDLREFLTNIMGAAAYYSPSEIIEADGNPSQATLTPGEEVRGTDDPDVASGDAPQGGET